MSHPYTGLPDRAFWRTGVCGSDGTALDIPDIPTHPLRRSERIVTAGSCFAQHIARALRAHDFNFIDAEPPPPLLPRELHAQYGYGLYSARYGNVYTSAQLRQLIERAFGKFRPAEDSWQQGGRWFDPFRPSIEPDGFESPDELAASRTSHLRSVKQLFREMDVFVFTLGLTESWRSAADGAVFPMCPGTVAGRFDAERHVFFNADYGDVLDDMNWVISFLRRLNPDLRLIFTVSPVPLTATASGQHVLAASTHAKAILRAVAGTLTRKHDAVDYFPSYEIVTSPATRGRFFEDNLRSVNAAGVAAVMDSFFSAFCLPAGEDVPLICAAAPEKPDALDEDVLCDESRLDGAAP